MEKPRPHQREVWHLTILSSHSIARIRSKAAVYFDDEELLAVEFLDDVTLRYVDDMFRHSPGESTHEILVRKGSVLRLAP